jgi:hypothetical protein
MKSRHECRISAKVVAHMQKEFSPYYLPGGGINHKSLKVQLQVEQDGIRQ